MLPVYEAMEIVKVIDASIGHTKPWVVLAKTESGLRPFVVKMYSTPQVEAGCVVNEVAGNYLAGRFGLRAPAAAFIDIPEDVTMSLMPEHQPQYYNADPRLKFASEELKDVKAFVHGLGKQVIGKKISTDTLYAFDNLIRNADRGQQKPNLLLGKRDAYVIDHEFILSAVDIQAVRFENYELDEKYTRYHIFHSYLQKARNKGKRFYFDEFSEYLRRTDFGGLIPLFDQMRGLGFRVEEEAILSWLNYVKQNETKFVNALKGSVQ